MAWCSKYFIRGKFILFSVFWMIFIVMLYPVIVIKHPTTHKTFNFYSTTVLNKDAHHAEHGRCRSFSAPCSTGEKEGHETSSGDKCERDGTSAKNNYSCSDSCRVNDRRRTNSAPCGSNSARDSKTASCPTQVNGKRKRPGKTKQETTYSTRMGIC